MKTIRNFITLCNDNNLPAREVYESTKTFEPEYFFCADCGNIIILNYNDDYYICADGKAFCNSDCAENSGYYYCDRCGKWSYGLNYIRDIDKHWCDCCTDNNATKCERCGEYNTNCIEIDDVIHCECCADRVEFIACEDCGRYTTDYVCVDENYYCSDCAENNKLIHDYTYKPSVVLYGEGRKYGLEIEVKGDNNTDLVEKVVGLLGERAILKSDSSIGEGFEIVTQPHSIEAINDTQLKDVLNLLKSNGYTAHNNDTCGMHIHVSKRDISSLSLLKIINFFVEHEKFVKLISQRKGDTLNQWASIERMTEESEQIYYICKNKSGIRSRYVAINLQNKNTIEFRIFNSNLRFDRILKNIEFVDSLIVFAKKSSLKSCNKDNYLHFICENKKDYQNIFSFLKEKEQI